MESQKIIHAQNISIGYKSYGRNKKDNKSLYNNLSFNLYQGELTCLIGVNGSGKSTLLRSISGNQPIIEGDVFINNRNLRSYNDKELSQLLGLVLTDKMNAGGLTVRQLVSLGRYPYTGFFGKLSKKDYLLIDKAMKEVNIIHKSDAYVAELSDGERQKALIAKAICQECPVLILDEPTAFLDIEGRIEIMSLLHRLAFYHNKTILISTHDLDLALRLADKLWLLSAEKGLEIGVTEDISTSGKLDTFFTKGNIIFEKTSGHFTPTILTKRKAIIKVPKELNQGVNNILNRNMFKIVNTNEFSDVILSVSSDAKMEIIYRNKTTILSNFEELANFLKKINREEEIR